jgi:hypothetical protein
MSNPKFEALLARVQEALKKAGITRKRQAEVTPMGNVVVVIKAPKAAQIPVSRALHWAQIAYTKEGLTFRVPLHLNTGFSLTLVEAGNEVTLEFGSFDLAHAHLTSVKADEARLEWVGVRGPERRHYRFLETWKLDVSAANVYID